MVLSPGETLAEVLSEASTTQTELATRTGLSTKHVNQVVHGLAPISSETALLLERATGVPARVWNNLEVAFREHESRQQEDERLAADLPWLAELPVNELIRRGWVQSGDTPIERLRPICQFFGVANRSAWNAIWHRPTAYRTSRAFNSDPGAVAVWLRIGEIKAASIDCAPFDRAGLTSWLHDVRRLTQESDPEGVEQEADGFAAVQLIPRRNEAELAKLSTLADAREFANRLGIAPGIVAGRLQHDKRWKFSYGNELKQRLTFSS